MLLSLIKSEVALQNKENVSTNVRVFSLITFLSILCETE